MNYGKITSEIIKDTHSKDGFRWCYDKFDENVYFTQGSIVYIIPEKRNLIDLDILEEMGGKKVDIKSIIQDDENYKTAETTKWQCKPDSRTVIKIKTTTEDRYCWVDEEYLKKFGRRPDIKIRDRKSPIRIYEKGIFVGLILPRKIKEDTK